MELREEIAMKIRKAHYGSEEIREWPELRDIFKEHWMHMADVAIEIMEKHEQISSSS